MPDPFLVAEIAYTPRFGSIERRRGKRRADNGLVEVQHLVWTGISIFTG